MRLSTVGTIVLAAAALVGILALLGSDLEQLRTNTASLRAHGQETAGWRDELTRYSLLSRALYGPPLRREWVALALLGVLAYLLRRRRPRADPLLDLAAPALGVALVLLIATPSKVPWHFGTLIAVAAVAAACETARLLEEARAAQGWQMRPFVVIAAAVVAAAWSWSPRNIWSDLDLRTLQWTLGVERRLTFAKAAGIAPLLLLGVLALVEVTRRRRRNLAAVPWRTAAWSVPVIAVPLILFTAGVFAADAAKTDSWTLTRQNLQTLGGRLDCGLADGALVPVRASMQGLRPVATTSAPAAAWLPPTPVPGLRPFALAPTGSGALPDHSQWFRLVPGRRMGFFLTGTPNSADTLALEWGRMRKTRVERLGAAGVAGDFATDARPDIPYWRFYSAGSLPRAPADATLVRFVLATNTSTPSGIALGLTPPVTYDDERLVRVLEHGGRTLALPNLVTYFPCLRQPRLAGTAEVPERIVAFRDSTWPLGNGTSPFDELTDVYPLVRLPLSDSPDPPGEVAVYEVDRRIAGAAVAPATATSAG